MEEDSKNLDQHSPGGFKRWGSVYSGVALSTVLVIFLLYAFSANYGG